MSSNGGTSAVRYRDLFRDREFSALFVADVLSKVGSQLGKFALAALVYDRTRSTSLTAITFAVTFLPGLLGGPILATLADRYPRRQLLITCDIIRAILMAIIVFGSPFMPVLASLGILLIVEFVRVPFGAARMAMLADILEGDRFAAGNALVGASQQVVQVAGFGVGGFVVVTVGAQTALLADTLSYAVSAFILGIFIVARPTPAPKDGKRPHLLKDTMEGIRIVHETGRLPTLFWLLMLGPTVLATAEGLAIPYADILGGGDTVAGLFLAAAPFGQAIGLGIVGRMSQRRRERVLIPFSMAVGLCVALTGFIPLPIVITIGLFLAGIFMGHIAHIQASIVGLITPDVRGRIIGLGNTVLQLGQGIAILLAGFVAEQTSLRSVLAWSGIGAVAAVFIVSAVGSPHGGRHRADPRQLRRMRRQLRDARQATEHKSASRLTSIHHVR